MRYIIIAEWVSSGWKIVRKPLKQNRHKNTHRRKVISEIDRGLFIRNVSGNISSATPIYTYNMYCGLFYTTSVWLYAFYTLPYFSYTHIVYVYSNEYYIKITRYYIIRTSRPTYIMFVWSGLFGVVWWKLSKREKKKNTEPTCALYATWCSERGPRRFRVSFILRDVTANNIL